jgi:hypothetical protein
LASRFRFAARHFIAYTRRSSAAPFHELVKGLEVRARFAVSKKIRRLQSGKLVLSSLLCRSTALFSERGNRRGYVIVSVIFSSSSGR